MTLERQLSDLVNEAYGLTPDEVNLLWDTAPPRMPISDPRAAAGLRPIRDGGVGDPRRARVRGLVLDHVLRGIQRGPGGKCSTR